MPGQPHNPQAGPAGLAYSYRRGCRCDACRAAITAHNRERRAHAHGGNIPEAPAGFSAVAGLEDSRDTGEDCPQCGSPLQWTAARTALICESDHFMLPAGTAERAIAHAEKPVREVAERAPIDMTDDIRFIAARKALARECGKRAANFDTSGIANFYRETDAEFTRDMFAALRDKIYRTTNTGELTRASNELLALCDNPDVKMLRSEIIAAGDQIEYRRAYNPEIISAEVTASITASQEIDTAGDDDYDPYPQRSRSRGNDGWGKKIAYGALAAAAVIGIAIATGGKTGSIPDTISPLQYHAANRAAKRWGTP